jgi:quercetin dioxygenase-like cupin family protein
MLIKKYAEIKATHFDNDAARGVDARVLIGKSDGADNFFMRIFEIAPGGYTPRHSHDWEHEMFVHSGQGEFYGNGMWNKVGKDSAVFVPKNEEHQMKNTGSEMLVVICLVPAKAPEL